MRTYTLPSEDNLKKAFGSEFDAKEFRRLAKESADHLKALYPSFPTGNLGIFRLNVLKTVGKFQCVSYAGKGAHSAFYLKNKAGLDSPVIARNICSTRFYITTARKLGEIA